MGGTRRHPDFTGLGKIAALGIKVSRHRTYHGVALNVAMDLEPYQRISPVVTQACKASTFLQSGFKPPREEVAGVLGKQAHGAAGALNTAMSTSDVVREAQSTAEYNPLAKQRLPPSRASRSRSSMARC